MFLEGRKNGLYRPVIFFISKWKSGERFDVQAETEGFILQSLIRSKTEELGKVSVESNSVRVLMLMF